MTPPSIKPALLAMTLLLTACAAPPPPAVPLIIAHRGLSGRFPEETLPAYEAAAAAGADVLEMDLHLSRDCVLVARHNPWLSDNSNVLAVAAGVPDVAARRRTAPKSLVVDGEDHTGDWSISDFTVAELKQWIRGTTYDNAAGRPTARNGLDPIVTFQEIIDLARARGLAVYPETKNPAWNNAEAIARGCAAPGERPFEDALLKIVRDNHLDRHDAPIFVQSFDSASLKYLRAAGLQTRVVQLIDGTGVDWRDGRVLGEQSFAAMLTPTGLAEVRTYADGIGPWKPYLMSWRITPARADAKGSLAEVTRVTPTRVIADAHAAGLFVHAFTFRDEDRYLPGPYRGDPQAELRAFFDAGLDGAFVDFTDTGVAARAAWLKRRPAPGTSSEFTDSAQGQVAR